MNDADPCHRCRLCRCQDTANINDAQSADEKRVLLDYQRDLLDHKAANLREIAALRKALGEALDGWDNRAEGREDDESRIAELRRLVP